MNSLRLIISIIMLLTICAFAQNANPKFNISVFPKKKQIILSRDKKPIMEVDSIQFNFISPSVMEVGNQNATSIDVKLVYKNVPNPGKVNVYNNYTVEVIIDKIDGGWHIHAKPKWARDISIYLKSLHGHYFGIRENLVPDNQKSPDITGSIQSFNVKGENDRYHENFASGWSAFFFNSLGYASFFNTLAKGEYQFAVNGRTEIYHQTGNFDWYIFTGTNGDQIMRSYFKIIGAPKYVPEWACGTSIWRDQDWKGKEDVLNDAKQMTALKIPISSIMVDRPFSNGIDGWSKMDFSPLFSNPGEWIHELNADYNLHFMTWVAPCTFGDTSIIKGMPGHHGYIDLSNPEKVAVFDSVLLKNIYGYGVQGNKMDRGDEVFPIEEGWYDHTPEWERRNKYIYLYAKTIGDILNKKWGKENFNYARAGMQGSQKYLSALWGGDCRESWDGLACSVANAVRCGFIGFPDWGSDVGGYRGDNGYEPEELYSRWLQFGTWSGMFEVKLDGGGGRGKDRAPWHYGKELQDNFRRACEERLEIAPYVFSQLNTSNFNGVMMKPLAYEYPDDPNTFKIWDEYCFGQSFIVAPVTEPGIKSLNIYLPSGNWYDWYSPSKIFKGSELYNFQLSQKHIPVFVKQNSIFVTGENWLNGNSKKWKGQNNSVNTSAPELIINVFPGKKDFTNNFSYVDRFNKDSLKNISVFQKENVLTIQVPSIGCKEKVIVYNIVPKGEPTVDGKKVTYSEGASKNSIQINLSEIKAHKVLIER